MPLPLAQGAKDISSKTFELNSPLEEDDIDGTPLTPVFLQSQATIATSEVLSATLHIHLFHMKRTDNDQIVKSKACIQIQVAPTGEPFSPRCRESVYRIDMDVIDGILGNNGLATQHDHHNAAPVAIFCRKFLVCLVAYQVIVFQLRKPLSQPQHPTPPVPCYISAPTVSQNLSMIIPVATNPRCVSSLKDVLCVCKMETMENTILLAGLQNGSIVVVSCKDVSVAGTLVQGLTPIARLAHVSMGKRGRLVAIDDEGCVSFFESHALIGTEKETQIFAEEDSDDGHDYLDESANFDQSRTRARPITRQPSEILRLHSRHEHVVLVHLTPMAHEYRGRFVTAKWIDSHFLALLCQPSSSINQAVHVVAVSSTVKFVTQLTVTAEQVLETSHSSFAVGKTATEPTFCLEYHSKSSCLLVSTHMIKDQTRIFPFSCCWHWRSNTTSLLLSSSMIPACDGYLSRLVLAVDLMGITKFVHYYLETTRLKKSLYPTAMLSPNNTSNFFATTVKEERPLLLGESYVYFPVSRKTCALNDSELDWHSTNIPSSYLVSSSPQIACISPDASLVAVASRLGLCILNIGHKKWRRFDQPHEEAFTVLAMEFWENLLLTIIETSSKQHYLACWSHKRLELSHQLLQFVDGANHFPWGIPLPTDFYPKSISLLSNQQNKAVVMISDSGVDPSIVLFQLEVSNDKVKCCVALHGGLSPNSNSVFLASAWFDFDLEDSATVSDSHVAVIGIIGPDKVTAAVASRRSLSGEKGVASGTLSKIHLSDRKDDSFTWTLEFSDGSVRCWSTPSSAISNANAKTNDLEPPVFICEDENDAHELGTISRVGDSAMWMLGSKETQFLFAVGCLPKSKFGCIMKIGQDSTKHHRIIPGDTYETLEHEMFSLGMTSLTTPAFLIPLVSYLMVDVSSRGEVENGSRLAHLKKYLHPRELGDTAFVALRLLVLRSVEMVASTKKKKEQFSLTRAFFTRVIQLLADALSPNAFAGFLLSLARQVEPSCMEHLFPLPDNSTAFQSIEDLYIEVIRNGSLATPSASLPLLSTKLSAREECKEILYHCLLNLSCSFLDTERELDTTREERRFVRDLFRFANQLEQMDETEFWSDSKLDVKTMPTVEEKKKGMVVASQTTTPQKPKSGSVFGILSPLICSGRRRREERAVYEAASTFIGSGFEEFEYSQVDMSVSERSGPVSVMYITGKLLVRLGLEEKHGWKRAAMIARLVLGDTVIDESGKGVLSWVQRTTLTTLAVTAHNLSKSKEYLDLTDIDEVSDVVTNYLVQGIFAANHEMTRSDAAWLLELVILSLSRLSPSDLVNQSLAPGLVLMATIVGHVSGRMEDMMRDLKKKDKNPLMGCYEEAKRSLSSI